MPATLIPSCAARLADLEAELTDLAFILDRRGRADAADVTTTIAARIAGIRMNITAAMPSAVTGVCPKPTDPFVETLRINSP